MTAINDYLHKYQNAVQEGRSLMREWEGKEMPTDISTRIDKFFSEAEEMKAKADELHARNERASRLERDLMQPEGKMRFATEASNSNQGQSTGDYAKAFDAYIRKKSGHPAQVKSLSSRIDTDGGIWVTEEFRNQLIQKQRNLLYFLQLATVIDTTAGSVSFPTFDYDATVSKVAENGQIPEESFTNLFGKTAFTPHKKARIFRCPNELIEDSIFDITGFLTDHFAIRFNEQMEQDFVSGTGSEEPLGILHTTLNQQDIAGSTTAIVAEDLIDVTYGLKKQYRSSPSCGWMLHRNVIKKIRKLKDSNGQFLWQPSLQVGQPETILGFPIVESEYFTDAVAGADGDAMAIFGDWKYYWVVRRTDMSVQVLNEKYADYDQTGYRMRTRYDGAPVHKDAFYRLNRN
jgi:HK97 family phage major capsid protein